MTHSTMLRVMVSHIESMKTENITISNNEKINLISNFATMLAAGISLLEVVDSLLENSKGNQRKVLQTLRADIVQGKRIHSSFARYPMIFDKVTVNIIKEAEESGTLDVTLKELRNSLKKEGEFADKIKSALTYPILIIIVFFAVLFLILIVVIPKIAVVFTRLKLELPLPTKILIFASDLLLKSTIPVMIVVLIFLSLLIFIYKKRKTMLLDLFSSLPFISGLVKEIELTRFCHSLFLLLNSGIPIASSLELAEDVVVRNKTVKVIAKSREMVLSGKRLSEGLKTTQGFIPGIMIKIIEAGEKSGSLDKSLEDVSEYLDYQVSGKLKTFAALLEPVMLIFVAIMVGGMMLSIIAPIYGLIGQVGQR